MADNTQVASGTGDTVRDKDRSGVKTQIVGLDLNISGSESLMAGSMPVTVAASATGTITSPALSATSFTVLASNTSRRGATFFNDSVNTLYLALASTASTTSYTIQVAPSGYYELPGNGMIYTGIVTGISGTASGNVRVTELT